MQPPDYDGAIALILARMRAGLSPKLTFHNLWHTEEDVLPAARRLAACSALPPEERRLLEVAAAYHDCGYLETCVEHERASMRIAAGILPGWGFSPAQVQQVLRLILATRMPQRPNGLLEQVLVDADLDVLGREDFWERNRALRRELENNGSRASERQWLEAQLTFLQAHRYFTPAARELREAGKQAHIRRLLALLGGGDGG